MAKKIIGIALGFLILILTPQIIEWVSSFNLVAAAWLSPLLLFGGYAMPMIFYWREERFESFTDTLLKSAFLTVATAVTYSTYASLMLFNEESDRSRISYFLLTLLAHSIVAVCTAIVGSAIRMSYHKRRRV